MSGITHPGLQRTAGRIASIGDNSNAADRTISYIFSDESVARDNHTIRAAGWDLTNFLTNPVFLWAHDDDAPPVGRIVDIGIRGSQLVGSVEYPEADLSAFGDMIFRMVKGGWLNAVSVRWNPIKWKFSADKSRPGGIDFLEQDLLEISQVPVPAAPTSIATARAAGIDTTPLVEWAEKILDGGGSIMVPRAELENLRREAKMPKAATKPTEAPAAAAPIDLRALAKSSRKRGLYEVASLCDLVSYADYVCTCVEREAADEGDGSPLPARMRARVDEGNLIIAAMAAEETAENIQGTQDPDVEERMARAVRAALEGLGLQRTGKVLSDENAATLETAHGMIEDARCMLRSVLDKAGSTPPDPAESEDDQDEVRARRARAAAAAMARLGV